MREREPVQGQPAADARGGADGRESHPTRAGPHRASVTRVRLELLSRKYPSRVTTSHPSIVLLRSQSDPQSYLPRPSPGHRPLSDTSASSRFPVPRGIVSHPVPNGIPSVTPCLPERHQTSPSPSPSPSRSRSPSPPSRDGTSREQRQAGEEASRVRQSAAHSCSSQKPRRRSSTVGPDKERASALRERCLRRRPGLAVAGVIIPSRLCHGCTVNRQTGERDWRWVHDFSTWNVSSGNGFTGFLPNETEERPGQHRNAINIV